MIRLFLLATVAIAQPVTIHNASVKASVYLPQPDGYYQATRFDWSGIVSSMEWAGHSIFGKWFDHYDPKIHDAITGPVEEFLTSGAGLGYAERSEEHTSELQSH